MPEPIDAGDRARVGNNQAQGVAEQAIAERQPAACRRTPRTSAATSARPASQRDGEASGGRRRAGAWSIALACWCVLACVLMYYFRVRLRANCSRCRRDGGTLRSVTMALGFSPLRTPSPAMTTVVINRMPRSASATRWRCRRAAHFARIDTIDALRGVTADARWRTMPRFILGGGSNLVLTGDFDGLMLAAAIPAANWPARIPRPGTCAPAPARTGTNSSCGRWRRGWPGLENLALIPGTVGAAPIQNIGAYGLEVAERFHALTAFDFASGRLVEFAAGRCRFGYRDSIFKQEGWHRDGRYLIVSVISACRASGRPDRLRRSCRRPGRHARRARTARRRRRPMLPTRSSTSASESCPTRRRSRTPAASSRIRWSRPASPCPAGRSTPICRSTRSPTDGSSSPPAG